MTPEDRLDRFLALSADVTAFKVFELEGTGLATAYLSTMVSVLGGTLVDRMLEVYASILHAATTERERLLRQRLFGDERLGPIARNIIKLWYVGIWYELPTAGTEAFGALENNISFMVSATAYTEGLLWPAIGAHPPGAKAPGYGSWVGPPQIPPV